MDQVPSSWNSEPQHITDYDVYNLKQKTGQLENIIVILCKQIDEIRMELSLTRSKLDLCEQSIREMLAKQR